jgi:hypothetical protein
VKYVVPEALTRAAARHTYVRKSAGTFWEQISADLGVYREATSWWRRDGEEALATRSQNRLKLDQWEAKAIVEDAADWDSVFDQPSDRYEDKVAAYAILGQWAAAEYRSYLLKHMESQATGLSKGNNKALNKLFFMYFPEYREKAVVDPGNATSQQSLMTQRLAKEVELLEARIQALTKPKDQDDDLDALRRILNKAHEESPFNPEKLAENGTAGLMVIPGGLSD